MIPILIIIVCIGALWWCVKPKLNINGETSPEIPRLLPTPVIVPPMPGGPPRDIPKCKPRGSAGSPNVDIVAPDEPPKWYRGETIPLNVKCKPFRNEAEELRHLGMLMQKPKFSFSKVHKGGVIMSGQDLMDELERRLK